jgi:hypothetical protein
MIAVTSVLSASYLVFRPSSKGIKLSYGLIIGTLITGFGLVVFMEAPILKTCISGLVFTSIVTSELLLANRRLSKQEN